ncbi:fluoride efflux transporter FluC [Indiicoccus explosivorum]|uniref:fluoride efflux transporter FluC n=1 Tax=Indiicoccus explosivorum TaxID=1917864 RepID=UPI000B44B3ED|nr:CrcB family protein [Indiicoccus explosivorum]
MIEVAVGGFLGAISRYLVYARFEQRNRHGRWATFLVNSSGSFLLGLVLSESPLWVTGFLGAFTTFSTFALDVAEGLAEGKVYSAAGYLFATIFSGLCLFTIGFVMV